MARWDEPTFEGNAGKIGSLALKGRNAWKVVAASTSPFTVLPVMGVSVAPEGASQVHHVNALDPGTTGYLRPNGDHGAVVPAGRMSR